MVIGDEVMEQSLGVLAAVDALRGVRRRDTS